jgi:HlyD family secretion protein
VQAYPNEKFNGTVKQVRLQSKTTENVVNYTVVVLVPNNSGKLLPGMTATLEFLTGTVTNALLVPNSALRFRPTDEMRAEVLKLLREQRAANGGGTPGEGAAGEGNGFRNRAGGGADGAGASRAGGFAGGQGGGAGGFAGRARNGQAPPLLWYLDENGHLMMARVRPGLTDGQKTAVESPRIKEGMQVIIGVNTPVAQNQNAFGPTFGPGGPGGPQRRPF